METDDEEFEELPLPEDSDIAKRKRGQYFCKFKPRNDTEGVCKEPRKAFDTLSSLR